jgi:hypothetical protein
LSAEREASPEFADRLDFAVLRRLEVKTDEIAAGIRDKDERRKAERLDQWILVALIGLAVISQLTTDQKHWPYISPTFLTAGVLIRLVWVTRGRGGPHDSR